MSKYFPDKISYPGLSILNIQPGTFYEYVCTPPLNLVSLRLRAPITRACLITRYSKFSDNQKAAEKLREPKFLGFHFDVGEKVEDDILILAKGDNPDPLLNEDVWWVLWFDRDCSDCRMGYFKTDDPDSLVISTFEEYMIALTKEMSEGYQGVEVDPNTKPLYLPVEKFTGWWHW